VNDPIVWPTTSLRARLSGLERRVLTSGSDAARLAPDCLRVLQNAVGHLEVAGEHLQQRDNDLRQARREMAATQRRLDALLALMEHAYLRTDETGIIVDANHAAARMLNLSPRFLSGRALVLFLAGERVEFLERLKQLADADEPATMTLRLRPRERHWLEVRARAATIFDEAGHAAGIQWLLTPLTGDQHERDGRNGANGTGGDAALDDPHES